ncbi:MAG: CBS domain-containing protein [Planctomycetes bacterium]|nr:CBS domain-containing protein [Planctomycetota bacterium]MCB9905511.1 CBS domain-containing protein [Planctomycetota bacterium]
MIVRDLMTADPAVIRPEATLDEALDLMEELDVRHLPVMSDGALLGVVSDRDLLATAGALAFRPGKESEAATLADRLGAELTTVSSDDSVVTAAVDLVLGRIGCLPVVDDGRLVGILTEFDLARAYSDACRCSPELSDLDPRVEAEMSANPVTIAPDETLATAAQRLEELGVRHLPVVDDGALVGILSDRDLRKAAARDLAETRAVSAAMTKRPLTVDRDRKLSVATILMHEAKISSLPVVENGRLVGILTLTDLLDHCMNALREPDAPRR